MSAPSADGIFGAGSSITSEEYKKGISLFRFVQKDNSDEASFSLSKKESAVKLALQNMEKFEYACSSTGRLNGAESITSIENGTAKLLPNGDWQVTKKAKVEYLFEKAEKNNEAPAPDNSSEDASSEYIVENLSLWGYFIKCYKNYVNFEGRARRKEFWGFVLFDFIIGFVLNILGVDILGDEDNILVIMFLILYCLFALASVLPYLAVTIRRLHDIGKSGWYWFIGFIPILGWILLLVWMCTDGDPDENTYGPSPK
jgi:uncharacterized membrane protein YhaH (DUF805 family)